MNVEIQGHAFKAFVRAVRACSCADFLNLLRSLNEIRALQAAFASNIFLGCVGLLGFVDCMNIVWKNCPNLGQSEEREADNCVSRGSF